MPHKNNKFVKKILNAKLNFKELSIVKKLSLKKNKVQ